MRPGIWSLVIIFLLLSGDKYQHNYSHNLIVISLSQQTCWHQGHKARISFASMYLMPTEKKLKKEDKKYSFRIYESNHVTKVG